MNDLPVVSTGGDLAVCLDAGVQVLTATPAGGVWNGIGVDPITGEFDPATALPGGQQVTYSYTDPATECSNSVTAQLTVNPLPVAAFTQDPIACAGVGYTFVNTSTDASSAQWAFGDGNTSTVISPSHSYASTGTYTVQLIAGTGAGCTDTITSTVTVWDVPVADPVLDIVSGCGPLEVVFANGSAETSFPVLRSMT